MKHDYNLKQLKRIKVRGLNFNLMPRYMYHYTSREYEQFSLDLLDTLIEKDSVVLDIGAHYGIYSLMAARKAKKVYAFEPVPENVKILSKNVKDNGFEAIINPINKAVSDKKGKVDFNITWASDSAGFYEHPNAEVIRKITVETNSIDNELKNEKNVSFIKIDTEGHEIHVLNGLEKTLRLNKPKMLIEYNPECLLSAGSSSRELISKILSLGYDAFAVYEESRYMVRVDDGVSDDVILQGQKYLNLLCLPRGSWQNVLFLSHNSSIGGAELVLLRTIQDLVKRHDKYIIPFVVFPGSGPLVEKVKELPIPYKIIPMRGWTDNKKLNGQKLIDTQIIDSNAITQISKIVAEFRPQVAFTNTMSIPWLAYVSKAFSIPHIWSIHEFGDKDHGLDFDYGYAESLHTIDELSNKILVNSKAVESHISRYISAQKMKVAIPNIDKPILSSDQVDPVYEGKGLKLIISGRITPTKGQLDAVKALHTLGSKGIDAELVIMGAEGSEDYISEIHKYCENHGLDKLVHFIGFKENPLDYISMADVLLMCSKNEAFGMVTVEAMLLGKAVVGTKSGGTVDIIEDGVNGLLYEPNNPEDLADKISSLAKNSTRAKLAEYARKSAQKSFPNSYYDLLYNTICEQAKVSIKEPKYAIFKDILIGMYHQSDFAQNEQKTVSERHQKEIAEFSDEYNKVYAAYNEVSSQLLILQNSKQERFRQKIARIRLKIKNIRKTRG